MKKIAAVLFSVLVYAFPSNAGVVSDTLSVFMIGDVMMHATQLKYDCTGFLEYIAPEMREADISIANMEFTLAGPPYSGYPCFSAPDKYAEYVAGGCGADVFLMANNHIQDKSYAGVTRTLEKYRAMRESYGIEFTGAAGDSAEVYRTYPLILERKGIKIAIINFSYGDNVGHSYRWPATNLMNKKEVGAAIDRAKKQNADFIIAMPHWGEEYVLKHNKTQQDWAEFLVDKGVDVIVGAHPHVVQDTTHINGVPVIYSMGNAVSNMTKDNTRLELSVTIKFTRNKLTGEKEMLEPEVNFMWCTLPGKMGNNFSTIYVKEWLYSRSSWATPSDYDNMIETWQRVKNATGINDGL